MFCDAVSGLRASERVIGPETIGKTALKPACIRVGTASGMTDPPMVMTGTLSL